MQTVLIPFSENYNIYSNLIDKFVAIIRKGEIILKNSYNPNRGEPNFGRSDYQVKVDEMTELAIRAAASNKRTVNFTYEATIDGFKLTEIDQFTIFMVNVKIKGGFYSQVSFSNPADEWQNEMTLQDLITYLTELI